MATCNIINSDANEKSELFIHNCRTSKIALNRGIIHIFFRTSSKNNITYLIAWCKIKEDKRFFPLKEVHFSYSFYMIIHKCRGCGPASLTFFLPTLFGKRGIFTHSPCPWVFYNSKIWHIQRLKQSIKQKIGVECFFRNYIYRA